MLRKFLDKFKSLVTIYQVKLVSILVEYTHLFFFIGLTGILLFRVLRLYSNTIPWEQTVLAYVFLCLMLWAIDSYFPDALRRAEVAIFRLKIVCYCVVVYIFVRERLILPLQFALMKVYAANRGAYFFTVLLFALGIGFLGTFTFCVLLCQYHVGYTIALILINLTSLLANRLISEINWDGSNFPVSASSSPMNLDLLNIEPTVVLSMSILFVGRNPTFELKNFANIPLLNTQRRYYRGIIGDAAKKVFGEPAAIIAAVGTFTAGVAAVHQVDAYNTNTADANRAMDEANRNAAEANRIAKYEAETNRQRAAEANAIAKYEAETNRQRLEWEKQQKATSSWWPKWPSKPTPPTPPKP